jgi:hypothetical protein
MGMKMHFVIAIEAVLLIEVWMLGHILEWTASPSAHHPSIGHIMSQRTDWYIFAASKQQPYKTAESSTRGSSTA